jgi:hypothetical protein
VQSCCPEGYTCELAFGGLFCQPEAATCTCNAQREGITRSCFLSGAQGEMCQGVETCGTDDSGQYAWSECEPSTVVVEVCDHLDNNCDGQVDEGFINDAGVYDTDEHCGECNINCVARWDQEIQHAIGGCVDAGGSLDCEIVACTAESVDGWGVCRQDDDCIDGTYCDPAYHHCINPNPGECPGGFCGIPCASDQDCSDYYGPGYLCDLQNNSCYVQIQFVNTNQEETDGCECASTAADPTDQPDLADDFLRPGENYVDRNCDGVDGEASRALFVWSGSTSSLGTRQNPFTTIGEALSAYDPSRYTTILVAAGYYPENLVLQEGMQLHGGYSPDFSRRDIVLFPSVIRGSEPDAADPNSLPGTVYAANVRNTRTVIAGFTIHGYDVNADPPPGQPGFNSYAVYARDCNANLVIANNIIIGGRGGDGADGRSGNSGDNGSDGGDGRDSHECAGSADCYGRSNNGGAGGTNPACPQADGNRGGNARGYEHDPQEYGGGGGNGAGGFRHLQQRIGRPPGTERQRRFRRPGVLDGRRPDPERSLAGARGHRRRRRKFRRRRRWRRRRRRGAEQQRLFQLHYREQERRPGRLGRGRRRRGLRGHRRNRRRRRRGYLRGLLVLLKFPGKPAGGYRQPHPPGIRRHGLPGRRRRAGRCRR